MKFNSSLRHNCRACTCKVFSIMYAHLDWDTFSIMTRGGPLGGRPCKNRATEYRPGRHQLTFFTRRFGLGLKVGILIFLAQNLRNSSLHRRVSFVELLEAFVHEGHMQHIILVQSVQRNVNINVQCENSHQLTQRVHNQDSYKQDRNLKCHMNVSVYNMWHMQLKGLFKPSSVGAPTK